MSSPPDSIPIGMLTKAQNQDLGPIIAVYPSRPMGFSTWLLILIIIVSTILIPFFYGTWSGYLGYINHGPAVVMPHCVGWIIFSFTAFLLVFLFLIRSADRSLVICRRGILLRKAPFVFLPESVLRAYYWHQVKGISIQVTGIKHRGPQGEQAILHIQRATIYPARGNPIQLRQNNRIYSRIRGYYCVDNLSDLCTRFKAFLYKDLFPRLDREFTAGHEVTFGPVIIQEKYLQLHRTGQVKIAWDKVHRLTIEAGKLVIELDDGKPNILKYRISVSIIPNIELMLNIIDRYVR